MPSPSGQSGHRVKLADVIRKTAAALRYGPVRDRRAREGMLADRTVQRDGVHTIPVPRGCTPEQAWEAIARGDLLTDPEPLWANVVVRDGRFVELLDAE